MHGHLPRNGIAERPLAPRAGRLGGVATLTSARRCRGCGLALPAPFLDFGRMPLANAFVPPSRAEAPEPTFPLAVAYCTHCHLVQLTDTVPPEMLFTEYVYFSSYSETVLAHARSMANVLVERFAPSCILEIASNDGYLLQYVRERGVRVL